MPTIAALKNTSSNQTSYFKKISVHQQQNYQASSSNSNDNSALYDEDYDIHYIQFRVILNEALKNNKAFRKKLTRKTNRGFTYDEAIQHALEEDNYQLLIDIWKEGLDVIMSS